MLRELETAAIFANHAYLKALIIFRLLTSATALVCMIVLELNRKKLVAHTSLKYLLNFHGFWTFLLCFSTFFESAERFYAHQTLKDPSDLLLTSNKCFVRMIPTFFGICGSVTSLLVMSAERFEASRKLSTYESSKNCSGMKFVLLHVSLTLLLVFANGSMYHFPTRVAHCTVVSVDGRPIQTAVTAILFNSELFTIFFYTKLLRRNKIVSESAASLNMSLYQLGENIRVLRLLLPIVISHTSITMAGAVGFFYFELAGFGKETYPIFEDTINMIYLQGIAMPLIFLVRYRYKRVMENRVVAANMASGNALVTAYDEVITKGW